MRYTRFEQIVLLVGGTLILSSVSFSVLSGTIDYAEIVAQALLFCVLFAAVRFGRRGGTIAAIAASVGYVLLLLPAFAEQPGAPDHMAILVLRLASFGVVGIIGGELCTRFRYGLSRVGERNGLDDWSLVYSQEYLHGVLSSARALFARHAEPFSAIVIAISPAVFAGMTPTKHRNAIRSAASHIRATVRGMDEVGRLKDGRFVVTLPRTPAPGAAVVSDRLVSGLAATIAARPEAVYVRTISLPADLELLDAFIDEIAPQGADDAQEMSGVYSSSADITRYPASERTVSAPSVSTLNTSTAASPEGSTKQ